LYLGKPFTDESGAAIFSQFSFDAKNTHLAATLSSITPVFEQARLQMSSGAADTLQLCFIVSDARIDSDNRLKLSHIMREMAERHVLAVLVVMDCVEDTSNSIFATKVVEFTPTGIVTSNYLDNFPFHYYIVIQKMESLPDVLAAALRQWFEMVSTMSK
jgi:midasin